MDAVFGNKVQKGFFEFFVGRSKHGQTSVAVHAVIGWALKIALGGELLPLKPGWNPGISANAGCADLEMTIDYQ